MKTNTNFAFKFFPIAASLKWTSETTIPDGYIPEDGRLLITSDYPELFSIIGYTYGGSGTTFNIPDTRGFISAARDNLGGANANRLTNNFSTWLPNNLNSKSGVHKQVLTTNNVPDHDGPNNIVITRAGETHSHYTYTFPGGSGYGHGIGNVSGAPVSTYTTSSTENSLHSHTISIGSAGSNSPTDHNNMQNTCFIYKIIRAK